MKKAVHPLSRLAAGGLLASLLASCSTVPSTEEVKRVDLDLLYIGAHPDDEASNLSTFGQWNEYEQLKAGVVTVTRGEGGGNAVGQEEGPALGLLREGEERRAVGRAGISHIYYLDQVDFYYTVSSPLTEQVWGREVTLEKMVRVIRSTRPEVIVTMNPSPTPGNHGHHQYAARLAVEAFYAAADPSRFPSQLSEEGLQPWRVRKLYKAGATGSSRPGPGCASTFEPSERTEDILGVWSGRPSARWNKTWAAVERDSQRDYASQGWHVWSDVPTDPAQLGCDYYTLIDSRVPYTPGSTEPTAVLEGALREARGGLPLGTELYLKAERFRLAAGQPFTVVAHVKNGGKEAWSGARVELAAPAGWSVQGAGELGALAAGGEQTTTFTVTPAAGAELGRHALGATLRVGEASGQTREAVELVPAVTGTLQPLAHVQQFRAWTLEVGAPQLDSLIQARFSVGVGRSRQVGVDLRNFSNQPQSGTVSLALPEGFTSTPSTLNYESLAPGEQRRVTFQVTNGDTSLPTSNQGPNGGDYALQVITTTQSGAESRQAAALNLVPVAPILQAATAPTVDGRESTGEYQGATLDLSRVWEGAAPSSAADASGSAKVVWTPEALYFLVQVRDDVLGTVLPRSDAKRHWRTDSVEIAIDPRGSSENTSTTFKVGAFPTTQEGGAAAYRDADNHQGPVEQTAAGLQVASQVGSPYTGYTLEVKIPFSALPASVDPNAMAINLFIYDSDTQDKTGQTRLGWSTWGGVQGDPYRWGQTPVEGYTTVAREPRQATMPLDVALSIDSPQLLLQSTEDGVPPGAEAPALEGELIRFTDYPQLSSTEMKVRLESASGGEVRLFVWNGERIIGTQPVRVNKGTREVSVKLSGGDTSQLTARGKVILGWKSDGGRTAARASFIQK